MPEPAKAPPSSRWTLITNHGAALLYVAEHPDATVREVADAIEVTERAGARLLRDLREDGYLAARRIGRRNVYELNPNKSLRHPVVVEMSVADLLQGLVGEVRGLRELSRKAARDLRRGTG